MRVEAGHTSPWAEWAWASTPLAGEPECADQAVVVARPDGLVFAVVDGLGHGADAVAAARKATATVAQHATEPLLEIFEAVHRALAGTRGAVMSLGVIDGPRHALAWTGVGDVEAVHQTARGGRDALMLVPGVLGDRIPRVRSHAATLAPGDVIAFASDGVRRSFADELVSPDSPQLLAERILLRHIRRTDDALALIVRYHGTA